MAWWGDPMATAVYCGLSDMQRELSAEGVNFAVDDDLRTWFDAAEEASREIDGYLLMRYSESGMDSNAWVRFATRTFACWNLDTRRGNAPPVGVQLRYEKYTALLEKAAGGSFRVPGLSPRRAGVPTLSLPRVVLSPVPHTVIERHRGVLRNLPQDYVQRRDYSEDALALFYSR
jgi:phage gp36-like protein